MQASQPNPKEEYTYAGQPGQDVPSFDPKRPLPARVQPKPRYVANLAMHRLIPPTPTQPSGSPPVPPAPGITGVLEAMAKIGQKPPQWMPANLTRCHPDKFSDNFFVERRLNGFNPGKFKRVKHQPWQYIIRYDCTKYTVEEAGILPSLIEARFKLEDEALYLDSIEFTLNGETETHVPGDADWEWSKRLFRSAEFVFQEIQTHLARTHMNIGQYAMGYYRNIVNNPNVPKSDCAEQQTHKRVSPASPHRSSQSSLVPDK